MCQSSSEFRYRIHSLERSLYPTCELMRCYISMTHSRRIHWQIDRQALQFTLEVSSTPRRIYYLGVLLTTINNRPYVR